MASCTATTRDGRPCGAAALAGGSYCFTHDPARSAERQEARRLGGRNRRTAKVIVEDDGTARLRTVGDVQAALERALGDTWAQENSGARTQAIVRVCMAGLKALEVGELEARLVALEARLAEGAS